MLQYRIPGRLGYNTQNNRYGLLNSDLWEHDGFHCGECLDIWDEENEKWVSTRMEMNFDNEWYLVGTPYRGDMLEGIHASIIRGYSTTGLDPDLLETIWVEG